MNTYKIEIQEILARVVEVQAISLPDAIVKVNEQYTKSEIILDYNDFVEAIILDSQTRNLDDEKKELINAVLDYLYSDKKTNIEEHIYPNDYILQKLQKLKSLIN